MFRRAERSRLFLRYVCDLTLRGEASKINQYTIASEVFQRGQDYSALEDSFVRRQAHVLRQKLNAYYAKEGRRDPVRIELPLGHYVPIFRRQAQEPEGENARPAGPPRPLVAISLAVLGALAFLALGWVLGKSAAPAGLRQGGFEIPASVREIWGPWLGDPSGALICFSNPMTAVVQHFDQPLAPGPAPRRLRATALEEKLLRETFQIPAGGQLYLTPSRVNAKLGESLSSVLLTAFLTRAGTPVRATQSRFLTWDELRKENLILLGHNEANPWIDPLLKKYVLRLGERRSENLRYILNTSPAPGEQAEYRVQYSENEAEPTQEYALVSMLPGIDAGKRLLLINGLNAQATQMAAEFLTDPKRLEELTRRLRQLAPRHEGAWSFQFVLRTEVRDKTPVAAEIVALRLV